MMVKLTTGLMKHGKSKVNSQNTLKTVKKSRVIELGLRVNKFIFLQLRGQTIYQTFLFLIYFAKMRRSFFKTKITKNSFQ
jgi:hypothetical protein